MKDYRSDDIENQSNISDRSDILYEKSNRRGTVPFYLRLDVADSFKTYAKTVTGLSMSEVVEKAFIEYMERNPHKRIELNIIKMEKKVVLVKDKLYQKALVNKLERAVGGLDRVTSTGNGSIDYWLGELVPLIEKAYHVKKPIETLLTILEKVDREGYLD